MSNQGLNRAVIAHLPDAPIKDELIAQIARQDPETPPPGCPIDDDLSVDLIKRRKSSFAAPLAAMLTSPAAIDAVAAREYRRAVWFGLAANPNLTFTALAHLTEYAGRQRSRVSEDLAYEVIVNGIGSDTRAAHHQPVAAALRCRFTGQVVRRQHTRTATAGPDQAVHGARALTVACRPGSQLTAR